MMNIVNLGSCPQAGVRRCPQARPNR
jgi:hypothetical protein